ncbi:hypothetical protein GCM10007977_048290 [Dactylosporangium sucinum]|uniref:Uncharacterized protein n=2 Tax=Dactylosporangium sucinum TaxID=1424081 RepID=A0A917WYH4_9ACTN|nr:hypothetical protein GCM10007977_048290 [Dactylosporangium sucinum]
MRLTSRTVPSEPTYLLGIVHFDCVPGVRARLLNGEIEFHEGLTVTKYEAAHPDDPALQMHLPAGENDCLLCQSNDGPLTEEHLWSEWISNYLTSHGAWFPQNRGFETAPAGPRPPVLCDDCNNRWGSVLEGDVKAIMVPMFEGTWHLDRAQQERLAVWATKTALVLDSLNPVRVVPRAVGHALRLGHRPPDGVTVWMSPFLGTTRALAASSSPLHFPFPDEEPDPSRQPNAFVATFTVFRVAFQVLINFAVGELELSGGRPDVEACLMRIWPTEHDRIDWTSGPVFWDHTLELLDRRIHD